MNSDVPPMANRATGTEVDPFSGKTLRPENLWVDAIRTESKSPAPTTQEPVPRPAVSLEAAAATKPEATPGSCITYTGLSAAKVYRHPQADRGPLWEGRNSTGQDPQSLRAASCTEYDRRKPRAPKSRKGCAVSRHVPRVDTRLGASSCSDF